jgi:hypothetical protein
MRNSVIALGLMVWALEAELANAAFIIQLKNGNEFVTGRHWQEGTQLMFDVYGGVLGVDRNFVSKIARSDKPLQLVTLPSQDEKPQVTAQKDESKPDITSIPSSGKTEVKMGPNDPLIKEFEEVKLKFSTVNGMLTSELNEFAKSLAVLKRKIQTSAKPNDYLNQFTELHKIGDDLEDTLNKRNQ